MRIYSKIVLDMTKPLPGGRFVTISEVYEEYSGVVALCKETDEQKNAANNLGSITSTLQTNYGTLFSQQQSLLDGLTNSIKNIVAAGPSQYGFTAQEDAALRTQADQGTAAAYKAASQATGEKLASIGGGNQFLPSGTAQVLQAQTANQAAAQQSSENLGITNEGYQVGRQNWLSALNEGNTISSQLNPNATAGTALSGAEGTFNAQTQIANEPTTGGVIGGILGSVAGATIGAAGQAGGFGKLFGGG